MIELQNDTAVATESISVEGLYELLQPYYGRVVRAGTVNPSTGERIRNLGRLQGLSFEEGGISRSGQKLFLLIEGLGTMLLIRRTSSVEVLQADSGEWKQIYLGSISPEAKQVEAA